MWTLMGLVNPSSPGLQFIYISLAQDIPLPGLRGFPSMAQISTLNGKNCPPCKKQRGL